MKLSLCCFLVWAQVLSASNILNTPSVDATLFRVTQFATGLPLPSSAIKASDGSLLVLLSPGYGTSQVVRFQDLNSDGVADGAPTILYSNANAGPATQIRQAGKLYYIAEFGNTAITALAPGVSPEDPLQASGSLKFEYAPDYAHPTPGIAVRPTPDKPGSIDLIFNVGSQYNAQASTSPVTVSGFGLAPTQLQGDSLYMITIDETGDVPIASNLRQVAGGIRNVYGMAFDPISGDLYFADNAIDEDNVTNFSEPYQADELNRIPAAKLGTEVLQFGFPNCYPEYRSDTLIETNPGACNGVTQSLINFQPVSGFRSEGPTEIAFSPALFPALYRNGIFVGFSGGTGPEGTNNQNPVVFANSTFTELIHFIESGTLSHNPVGIYSTADSLFILDWGGGSIYQITALADVPEPAVWLLVSSALCFFGLRKRFGPKVSA
ncbi:PQQ-dependent sugar dehydrogenase [Bryobacter aggregatus]|uniref:PQQ-dependent sugar dehydrogenase n=1 Tax=Bryobacter aggregatus TaxID=360054 RepID=UPI0004E25836|nr:hypothetical protein [Bryobacter aggregatus]